MKKITRNSIIWSVQNYLHVLGGRQPNNWFLSSFPDALSKQINITTVLQVNISVSKSFISSAQRRQINDSTQFKYQLS